MLLTNNDWLKKAAKATAKIVSEDVAPIAGGTAYGRRSIKYEFTDHLGNTIKNTVEASSPPAWNTLQVGDSFTILYHPKKSSNCYPEVSISYAEKPRDKIVLIIVILPMTLIAIFLIFNILIKL